MKLKLDPYPVAAELKFDNPVFDDDRSCQGLTEALPSGKIRVSIKLDENDLESILGYAVHEIEHVKQIVEDRIGAKLDDESAAYFVQNLFVQIYRKVLKAVVV